jgi:ATP-dependent helicase HepA
MKHATSDFTPGQRWISETQTELGLGLVEAVEHRRVRMLFPATGERRTYAVHDAPLWRAQFGAGERIRDVDGRELVVTATETDDGLVTYHGQATDGREISVHEAALDPHLRLNRPQQKLLAGRLDRDIWFDLRQRTWQARTRAAASIARGLAGPRISLIPHQLYIGAEVADRHAPRVLLADEVGLGKTIEAGLILHRLLLAGRAKRVLILVPEPLLHQWLVELLRRFNLRFALFDEARMAAAASDGTNPFQDEQRVLCSLDLLTAEPANARAVLAAGWDLLICDEAHHLHWTPDESSLDYDLVAALAAETAAVLLLTATPEQLGRAGHFGRLRLLDPRRFSDYGAFLAEEADYAPVADIAARLMDAQPLEVAQQQHLHELLGDTAGLSAEQVIDRLLDRHGTGRILFRNTRAAITGFPQRRVHPAPLEAPAGYGSDTPWPERSQGDWTAHDPRLPWLIDRLRALRPAKVLLICAGARTVMALRQALQDRAGIHAAVFHEGMEIVERDRSAAYFADPDEGSQVLLCSEIGSEGRNFQFAHHLVLFDLPLDPELLEQRIGRLDRIGQTRTIEIHVPYLGDTPGETLYRWTAEGLDALSAPCPAATAVFERFGERLQALLAGSAPPAGAVDALVAEAAAQRERLNAELAAGRDRLLELGSQRPAEAAELVNEIERQDRDPGLFQYLARFWDAFGVEHEPGPGGATVLRPGKHMLQERFPGLPDDGLTVTFDRAHALAHEERAFLTWEHPLVHAAMDLITGSDLGSSVVNLTRDPRFGTGALLLDAVHIAECPAPPALRAGRFLPPTALRLLIDERGQDRSTDVDPAALTGKDLSSNRKLARTLVEAKADAITTMLGAIEPLVEQAAERLRQQAIERMTAQLDEELERLIALARINPAIRPEEIDALRDERERLAEALGHIRLRLDALRLIAFA